MHNRYTPRLAALAVCALAYSLQPAAAQTTTIYSEDFEGTGDLNGTTPEVGDAAWLAGPAWQLGDGVASQGAVEGDHAFLPFTPEVGTYYILSLDLDPESPGPGSWTGLGYSQSANTVDGPGNNTAHNFHENGRNVGPWALKFDNARTFSFVGPRDSGGAIHPGAAVLGQATTFDVCLDTRDEQWLALWRVDEMYLRTANVAQSTRDYVGFGIEASHGATSVDRFSLIEVHAPDPDGDLVSICEDNCPNTPNPDQADVDNNGIGDACEGDEDEDDVIDRFDNCPEVPNTDQGDIDEDGTGDVCDDDIDGDDLLNDDDNCPSVDNDQTDTDEDGIGDACDDDDDNDGYLDDEDNCPLLENDQTNSDTDDDGDVCDDDDDNDDVPDSDDNCRIVANDQLDTDEDNRGDACDDDDDADGVLDNDDNCVLIANDQTDTDEDGDGNACDDNDDDDDFFDDDDNCPVVVNNDQMDTDEDGRGDVCDDDDDDDDIPDAEDCAPTDDSAWRLWTYYADDDADGFGDPDDSADLCLAEEGWVRDDTDNCPIDNNLLQTDTDRDGLGDVCDDDDDDDNVLDDDDNCLVVANPNQTDTDTDGIGDACDGDEDGDEIADEDDNCPSIANAEQADLDEDGIGDACDMDKDGDGVNAPDDCDDLDETVAQLITYFEDVDGDGLGMEGTDLCETSAPEGYGTVGGDNCPDVANADQADSDDDGVGDACTDAPIDSLDDELDTADANVGGDCGCQSTSPAGWLPVGLLILLAFRRRRQQ